jgi:uncharacterized protein
MIGTTAGTIGETGSGGTLKKSRALTGVLRLELLVLQPTSFCNIDCSYCYLPARHVPRRMSRATLECIAERILASRYVGDRVTVVWHAGEPLVLPVDYYDEAFALLEKGRRAGLALSHSFQTNGILLTDRWARFIRDHGIRVGVSIDGPARFHDRYRLTRRGQGTHERALAGIRNLQAAEVDFHVITVLTTEALAAPDEFFDFYVANGIRHVGFNIEEIEGPHTQSSLQSPDAERAYAHFMRRIIERVADSSPGTLFVRELEGALSVISDPGTVCRNHQVEPLAIVSLDSAGNICTFSPELLGVAHRDYADFAFGNVHEHDLDDVLASAAFGRAYAEIRKGVRRCAETCAYFDYCGGGAPANKLFENGDFATTETLYCRLTKQTLLEVTLASLERSLGLTRKAPS